LNVDGRHFAAERAAGFASVTVVVGWNDAEPTPGDFSAPYLDHLSAEVRAARRAGLAVSLDPGLQYAPAWVFALPGGTRFVDQYGAAFTGAPGSGDDVANAVTDPAVRRAEAGYLAGLARALPRGLLASVRVGGGPDGELRYPDATYGGRSDCWWAFDASTLARATDPGWVPGTGTAAQARSFLVAYNARLAAYGAWLDATVRRDLRTTTLLMLPGWGERPGVATAEVASRLTLGDDEFNSGADWPAQLAAVVRRSGADASGTVAYTTWLDAPAWAPSPAGESPVAYLAGLARADGLRLGGENTGGGAAATYALCLARARAFGLVVFNWMDEAAVVGASDGAGAGVTFDEIRRDRTGPVRS
jgi:hypothetical protein